MYLYTPFLSSLFSFFSHTIHFYNKIWAKIKAATIYLKAILRLDLLVKVHPVWVSSGQSGEPCFSYQLVVVDTQYIPLPDSMVHVVLFLN